MIIHLESKAVDEHSDSSRFAPPSEAGIGPHIAYCGPQLGTLCEAGFRWPLNVGFVAFCAGLFAAHFPYERLVENIADEGVPDGRERDPSI
jgi:hypothetical protein